MTNPVDGKPQGPTQRDDRMRAAITIFVTALEACF
jgi:hypothetical protein